VKRLGCFLNTLVWRKIWSWWHVLIQVNTVYRWIDEVLLHRFPSRVQAWKRDVDLTERLRKWHIYRTWLRLTKSSRHVGPAAVAIPRHLAFVSGVIFTVWRHRPVAKATLTLNLTSTALNSRRAAVSPSGAVCCRHRTTYRVSDARLYRVKRRPLAQHHHRHHRHHTKITIIQWFSSFSGFNIV